MKTRFLALALLAFALLFVSCSDKANVSNEAQLPDYEFDFDVTEVVFEELEELYEKYETFLAVEGTYALEDFRKKCGYGFDLNIQIGQLYNHTEAKEVDFGGSKYTPSDKAKVRLGTTAYVEDLAFVVDNYYSLHVPVPMATVEFLDGAASISINKKRYFLEEFPKAKDIKSPDFTWREGETTKEVFGEESYTVYKTNKESANYLEFKCELDAKAYITSEIYMNENGDIVDSLYGFAKAEKDGSLKLYPFTGESRKDVNKVIYRLVVWTRDDNFHYKQFIVNYK